MKFLKVVDVDKVLSNFSIYFFKVKTRDYATISVVFYTFLSCNRIPFIDFYRDLFYSTFSILFVICYFFSSFLRVIFPIINKFPYNVNRFCLFILFNSCITLIRKRGIITIFTCENLNVSFRV